MRTKRMIKEHKSLENAKKGRREAFYMQLKYIERECRHYRKCFEGKVVFCNCDDPYESSFFKYFAINFNAFGLKKLITTSYKSSPIAGKELPLADIGVEEGHAYSIEISEVKDWNGDDAVDLEDVRWLLMHDENAVTQLDGDGDFRSPECVKLLKQADIVVAAPPYKMLKEYVDLLRQYGKQFLIAGNQNAVTYKGVFPWIMNHEMWMGYNSGHTVFYVPQTYTIPGFYDMDNHRRLQSNGYCIDSNGFLWRELNSTCWYTNIETGRRYEEMILYRHYHPEQYPRYDNFDAIDVSLVADIPKDYYGVMGVPLTFLTKYCPEQFEILGITDRYNQSGLRTKRYDASYGKGYSHLNANAQLKTEDGYKSMFVRILIRRKTA